MRPVYIYPSLPFLLRSSSSSVRLPRNFLADIVGRVISVSLYIQDVYACMPSPLVDNITAATYLGQR
jgi:hypothetical protein